MSLRVAMIRFATLARRGLFIAALGGLGAFANSAYAVTIHDEAVDGDLANFLGPATDNFGVLTNPVSRIFGSLDGGVGTPSGNDEIDIFTFTSMSAFSLDVTVTNNTAPLFIATDPDYAGLSVLGGFPFQSATISSLIADPGTYTLRLLPQGNSGSLDYQIDIRAVPLPAAFWLFASTLVGLFGIKRARQS